MRASGLAGFLALFAILCTIFSAVVTIIEVTGDHPERLDLDLRFVVVSAIAAVSLLLAARHLRAHELRVPEAPPDPNAPHPGWGLFAAGLGLLIIGVAAYRWATWVVHPKPDEFLVFPAGLIFFFAGLLIAMPGQWVRRRALVQALLLTSFAVTFDWVAFGPGERHFKGSVSVGFLAIGSSPGEILGRILFGIPAVFSTGAAILAWARLR